MNHNKNIVRMILRKDELNFCDVFNFAVFVKEGLRQSIYKGVWEALPVDSF